MYLSLSSTAFPVVFAIFCTALADSSTALSASVMDVIPLECVFARVVRNNFSQQVFRRRPFEATTGDIKQRILTFRRQHEDHSIIPWPSARWTRCGKRGSAREVDVVRRNRAHRLCSRHRQSRAAVRRECHRTGRTSVRIGRIYQDPAIVRHRCAVHSAPCPLLLPFRSARIVSNP